MTVAAHKKVTFELTYEELLKRRHGKYELQIHARPMQPVKDFKVSLSCWDLFNEHPEKASSMVRTSYSFTFSCILFFFFFYHSQCQVDVNINEEAGINFIEVKGGLSTKALANAITKTHADKQVQHALVQIYEFYWLPNT